MTKEKVWIMNHYATNMFFNRGGRHFWFAKNLLINGYEPTIFCANVVHSTNEEVDLDHRKYSVRVVDGIPFVFVRTCKARSNGLDRIANMVLFACNLYAVSREYREIAGNPDIIIASSVHPLTLVVGIEVAKKLGIPCICEVRDLWPEAIFNFGKVTEGSLVGGILTAGEHWIYRQADAIVFTKEGDVDYIKEKGWDTTQGGDIDLNKIYYINNGVDIKQFDENCCINTLDDPDLNEDKFNVVYVGAIRPVNNVGNILDAAYLLRSHDDIQFLIFGDGSERRMLEQRVLDEKLTNVKIKGFVNKQFIPYILSMSSVNLLNYSPTQYNWARGNSSNKLFEYMASGRPIISTVKMGYSIIEKYKCGFELENGTPRELADAILKVKEMPKEEYDRLGRNARLGAFDFDFGVLTEKLIEVIEAVLAYGR